MKWTKVLKLGTFRDSAGVEHTFNEERLDNIVKVYNEQPEESRRMAPHVLGHPKSDDPAMGWVTELRREGDFVYAGSDEKDFIPEFVDAVNKGLYRFRSVSLYPSTDLLRHVGWLGAAQPAVPGLGAANLSEADDSITIDFMDWDTAYRLQSAGSLFQRIREWFIEQFGVEKADEVISQWEIDDLKRAKATDPIEYTEPSKDEQMTKEQQEKLDKLTADFSEVQTRVTEVEAENNQLKTDLAARDQEIATLREQVAETANAAKKAEFEAYCDGLINDGRMLPAERDYFVDELVTKSKATGEFAQGESPLEKVKSMLEARAAHGLFNTVATNGTAQGKPQVDFAAFGEGSVNEERAALHARIKQVQAEKSISFEEAMNIVVKENA